MIETPFFSIVITTYNRAHIIEQALQSILRQSFTDWEAIIIDDGSEDQTDEVIRKYVNKYPFRYFYQANKGAVQAKNAGIQKAKGKYITLLDSDDVYAENHLSIRHKYLSKNREIDFLHGGVKIIGSEYVADVFNPTRRIHLSECAISGTFVVKSEVMKSLNGFKVMDYGHDHDFLQRAQQKAVRILKIDEPTYIYNREGLDSITHEMMKKRKTQ